MTGEEKCSNIDFIWVNIIEKNRKLISLGLFYRPPDSTETQLNFLLKVMNHFIGHDTIIIGDFNFPDINWRTHTSGVNGKIFLKHISTKSLIQCVKKPTRALNTLDLVLVYDKSLVGNIEDLTPIKVIIKDIN